ncbi:MAG: DUF4349 domain-containing protein, partial [Microbacterium sp.]
MNDIALPELDERRIAEIEDELFGRIAAEREDELRRVEGARVRAVRRGRIWMGGAAAAAVLAVAAVIGPTVLSG